MSTEKSGQGSFPTHAGRIPDATTPCTAQLSILVRTSEQLDAVLSCQPTDPAAKPAMIYCDYQDIRSYSGAVAKCRQAGVPVALATLRIVKPGEQGLLEQIARSNPDAVLVRNLAAVSFYSQMYPNLQQIGDYSLNVANEITAAIFRDAGLRRMVPSYDLNWKQLATLLTRIDSTLFECVIHQHMPMFHMEHCVFAHLLSGGKDYHTCGQPCEKHQLDLSDRMGQDHPLIADVGCRNTLFNAQAQTAAEYVSDMKQLGVRHFRIELLRENADEALALMQRYARVIAGAETGLEAVRSLRVLNQLGVTRGTLARE